MKQFTELIEYALKAPSGHNTQPWRFRLTSKSIDIYPDFSRSLSVVDGNNRELYISLGTATENLCIAARHFGYQDSVSILADTTGEYYVHADGMVRYIRENQLLLTNYQDFDNLLRKKILKSLGSKFQIIELHYDVIKPSEQNWAYINYLRTKDIILLPWLGIEEDNQAIKQFEMLFPEYKERIVPIDTRSLTKLGGALNCISWNVKSNQGFRDYCSAVQRFKSIGSCIKLSDNINKERKQWN